MGKEKTVQHRDAYDPATRLAGMSQLSTYIAGFALINLNTIISAKEANEMAKHVIDRCEDALND